MSATTFFTGAGAGFAATTGFTGAGAGLAATTGLAGAGAGFAATIGLTGAGAGFGATTGFGGVTVTAPAVDITANADTAITALAEILAIHFIIVVPCLK